MRRSPRFNAIIGLSLLFGVVFPLHGWGYVYVVTAPVSGSLQLGLTNYTGQFPYGGGGSTLAFQKLTMLVDIDLKAFTMRQVGIITGKLNTPAFILHCTEGYPNPIIGDISVNQEIVGSGFSFDTGVLPLEWISGSPQLAQIQMPSSIGALSVNGSYALTTGGQVYQGKFNYSTGQLPIFVYTTVALSSFPASITLSNFNNNGAISPSVSPPRSIVQMTAANQFYMNLGGGIGDGLDYLNLSADPVTVTNGR